MGPDLSPVGSWALDRGYANFLEPRKGEVQHSPTPIAQDRRREISRLDGYYARCGRMHKSPHGVVRSGGGLGHRGRAREKPGGSSEGMRGGRLDDNQSVVPQQPERIPQMGDFFLARMGDFFAEGLCFDTSKEGEGGAPTPRSPIMRRAKRSAGAPYPGRYCGSSGPQMAMGRIEHTLLDEGRASSPPRRRVRNPLPSR